MGVEAKKIGRFPQWQILPSGKGLRAHARGVGKGLGAAAPGAAAGEARDDIPISKELARVIIEKRLTRAFSSRIAAGHKEPNAALFPKNLTRTYRKELLAAGR